MAVLGSTKVTDLTLLDGVIGNLNPVNTGVYDLGTSSLKWRMLYGNVTGDLTGNASSATKLKNGRTFLIKDADNTNAGTASSAFDGQNNLIINLPSTIKATLSGNASSATALTSNAGSSSIPVYFTSGKPSAISNISLVATNTDSKSVNVGNSNGQVELLASTNRGVYDTTNSKWIVYTAQTADHTYIPLWSSKGSATLPVYFNSSGEPVACTSYANASVNYATSAGSATNANYVNLYEARGTTTTLNKSANYVGAGKMFHLVASSSTSTTDNGKPPMGDANILLMNWDNNGGYDCLLAISTGANRMEFRDRPSTKNAWREVVTSTPGTAAGSSTLPVYISTTGIATACNTTLEVSISGTAATATNANNVKQNNQTGNNDYRLLLSGNANDTPETTVVNKSTNLTFNPSTKILKVGGSIETTGNLSITGNSTLSGETSITSLTAGSLLVNGNANFTLIPTAPTPATSSNDTSIATTAFVKNNLGGLSGAMHFKGTTTTTMSDGLTTAAVTIGGTSYTPSAGDVVLYSDSEFVWTGSAWERLGRDSSFKTTQSVVTTATAETTTATTFVYSVTQDANGVITVKTRPLPTYNNYSLPTASTSTKGGIKVGSGLTMSSETLNHTNSVTAKTSYGSTATTASANGGTIIVTDIKYDAQGHITASTDRTITLSLTTYGAEKGISLSSGKFGHSNTSITAKTAAALAAKTLTWGGTFTLYEEKYDTYGHITGVASYNMTMPSNPNTDTKQKIKLATTTKAYITGVNASNSLNTSGTDLEGLADTDVYLTTTAGLLNAKTYLVDTHVILQYDSALLALEFAFI